MRILSWLIFGRFKSKTQIYRVKISSSHGGLFEGVYEPFLRGFERIKFVASS